MDGMVSQMVLLVNSLSTAERNHSVISQNIANANTPNYRAKELDFEAFLEQVRDGSAGKGLIDELPIEYTQGLQVRKDGNNVDLDAQVGELKKNALVYQAFSQILASRMEIARRAMSS